MCLEARELLNIQNQFVDSSVGIVPSKPRQVRAVVTTIDAYPELSSLNRADIGDQIGLTNAISWKWKMQNIMNSGYLYCYSIRLEEY